MHSVLKKVTVPKKNEMTSKENNQEVRKEPKVPETEDKIDVPQFAGSLCAGVGLDLLSSFQELSVEEQKLLEVKQSLLVAKQDLECKLVKEIDKKKLVIAGLISEIPVLQEKCKQLAQSLDIPFTDSLPVD